MKRTPLGFPAEWPGPTKTHCHRRATPVHGNGCRPAVGRNPMKSSPSNGSHCQGTAADVYTRSRPQWVSGRRGENNWTRPAWTCRVRREKPQRRGRPWSEGSARHPVASQKCTRPEVCESRGAAEEHGRGIEEGDYVPYMLLPSQLARHR